MITQILLALAAFFSILGAILNGYGTGKKKENLINWGQRSWVVSNALWIGLYLFLPTAIAILPATFQLLTFGTFMICALYSVIKSL